MANEIILDPKEWNQLTCGRCMKQIFHVLVHVTGVVCICSNCKKQYKLESASGVKIANA
jgi:hypothetical protein